MRTLRDVAVGQSATVVKLHGEGKVKRRIMDMGITKGISVYVRKVAPLGDPLELTVRGYELSIRKADAQQIEVLQAQICTKDNAKFVAKRIFLNKKVSNG